MQKLSERYIFQENRYGSILIEPNLTLVFSLEKSRSS